MALLPHAQARGRWTEGIRQTRTRRDRQMEAQRDHEVKGPAEPQRDAGAPPEWRQQEGNSKAREKADEEEYPRWSEEVTAHLLSMTDTRHCRPSSHIVEPEAVGGAFVCQGERGDLGATGGRTGVTGLSDTPEVVHAFLEQRASEHCPLARAALAFYEEAAGLHREQRLSQCPWFEAQSEALERTLTSKSQGPAW